MDKFSYAIGLGIGQNLLSMGARNIEVNDFAQAIKDVLEGNQTAISHTEAREIVNKYFTELEAKINAENIEKGKAFLEENKKNPNIVTLPSGHHRRKRQETEGYRPRTLPLRRYADRRNPVRQFYQTWRTGRIRCQPGNQRMGRSSPADV